MSHAEGKVKGGADTGAETANDTCGVRVQVEKLLPRRGQNCHSLVLNGIQIRRSGHLIPADPVRASRNKACVLEPTTGLSRFRTTDLKACESIWPDCVPLALQLVLVALDVLGGTSPAQREEEWLRRCFGTS